MQQSPLLERLDWVFSSAPWTLVFPNTIVVPLRRNILDHVSCVVKIDTQIPKSPIFRFENYWFDIAGSYEIVSMVWALDPGFDDPTKCISFKIKMLRKKLLNWSKNMSKLNSLLTNCNRVIDFLYLIEEARLVSVEEWNFRKIVKGQVIKLLEFRKIYWKKRCTNSGCFLERKILPLQLKDIELILSLRFWTMRVRWSLRMSRELLSFIKALKTEWVCPIIPQWLLV